MILSKNTDGDVSGTHDLDVSFDPRSRGNLYDGARFLRFLENLGSWYSPPRPRCRFSAQGSHVRSLPWKRHRKAGRCKVELRIWSLFFNARHSRQPLERHGDGPVFKFSTPTRTLRIIRVIESSQLLSPAWRRWRGAAAGSRADIPGGTLRPTQAA
jgi:hypothetical protein